MFLRPLMMKQLLLLLFKLFDFVKLAKCNRMPVYK